MRTSRSMSGSPATTCWTRVDTAARQVGTCPVIDAPLPLLAQFAAELPADQRQEYLDELVARLPVEGLPPLADAMRARLDASGA